jgi:hypothetical protein
MDVFDCHGQLQIAIFNSGSVVFVKLIHRDDHIPYWNIDVPKDIRDFVVKNLNLTPQQVSASGLLIDDQMIIVMPFKLWDEILRMHPQPKFSRKTIYNLWSERVSKKWKRDEDEVKSAKILIEEASSPQNEGHETHGLYTVMPVPLHDEPGFVAIAFVLKEVLRQWGGRIREISLDSTCVFFYQSLHLFLI